MYSKKIVFYTFLCVVIHLWILQYFYYLAENFNIIISVSRRKNNIEQYPKNAKYILVWNKYNNILKRFGLKNGLTQCSVNDCVYTDDRNVLYDYVRYDAVIYNEFSLSSIDRPSRRSKSQIYVFGSQTSSRDAPACELYNDNFFNVTFTYRVDSDVLWSYILVRNLSGEVIAPKALVNWKTSLNPVSIEIKSLLIRKRKAAIWIVDSEDDDSSKVEYLRRLQEHLFHYSLKIDAYGQPPRLKCPYDDCSETIRDKYYFYMAFENSFSVDHVTDIVLHGYQNYAVPIVYGGANYSRFLPPGSFINARDIHPYNLAHVMFRAINDPLLFEAYFRWTNLYSIQDNYKWNNSLCNLCDAIHSFKANSVAKPAMKQFRRWWNGLKGMQRCVSEAHWNESVYFKANHIFH